MPPLSPQDKLDLKPFIKDMIDAKNEAQQKCRGEDPQRAAQLRKDIDTLRGIYARLD